MNLTDETTRVPLSAIVVKRDERQRRKLFDDKGTFIDPTGLVESIRDNGVLQPILIHRDMTLVFGERRFEASKLAGREDILVRFIEDLDPIDAQMIELTENLSRLDMPWRDEVASVEKIHKLALTRDPKWSALDTSKLIFKTHTQVIEILRVARDVASPRLADATSVRSAYNVLSRIDERATADALGDIIDAAGAIFDLQAEQAELPLTPPPGATEIAPPLVPGDAPLGVVRPISTPSMPVPPTPPPESILNLSFLDWAPTYEGSPFNLIHCDFPYGVNVFAGKMSGRDKWKTDGNADEPYSDDPEVYTKLIKCLCENLDRVMSVSGHLMFWLSADIMIQHETISMFRQWAPSLIFQTFPLIWHKTDNVGVLPDPKRGPRRVYETCLLASREDRLIIKSVSNAYGAPTNKEHHPSTKPEPMLRYYMSMLVDENTRMLDPTCGSGSSLRAAESLGAKQVLGLELDAEHCKNARHALKQFRILRKVAK